MRVPDYIFTLLQRRCSIAQNLNATSLKIEEWLIRNGIEPDLSDRVGGLNTIKDPLGSMERVIKAIEDKES